jgi:hypothetical protein
MQAFLSNMLFEVGLAEGDVQHPHLVKLVDELSQLADGANLANLDETLTALAASRPWDRHKRSYFPQHV